MLKVLVVGSGGREHALVWKLAQSPRVTKVFCAPGNAGIATQAECVPIPATDLQSLRDFALAQQVDFTVVGPEAPLAAGIADVFRAAGLRIFGPSRAAARLESSKAFAKELMAKYGIPTGRFQIFHNPKEAKAYLRQWDGPCAVKADGLAAGKGVIVAADAGEALRAVDTLTGEHREAAAVLVVEEFLAGEEVTVMAFTDGKTVKPMVWAQDHKRVFDGDQGPNTGGMGAYSPTGLETPALQQEICERILVPVVAALAREGTPYRGVLYAGLILTEEGPKVLEFNARFGDPECQVVLPRLQTDLVEILEAVENGVLADLNITWAEDAAVCVVLASGGYPGPYRTGYPITGLEALPEGVTAFHAGTAMREDQIVTAGGRVLGITALGPTLPEAVAQAYRGVEAVRFTGCHYRRDIAWRALARS